MLKKARLRYLIIGGFMLLFNFMGKALLAQESLKEILRSSRDFEVIKERGDAYFANKHPNSTPLELTQGPNRDGEFVKYMRWQSFWQQRLTADGQLGTLKVNKKRRTGASSRSQNAYSNIPWTNISHQNYITGQIGMGRTTSVAFHPTNASIFYVGSAMGGIWKTENGGQSYTPLGDDLPYLAVSSIVVNQNNPSIIHIALSDHLWYGPGGIGVYQSTDGGSTWQPTALSFNIAQDIRIYWMEASPNDPNLIFVATQDGLYKTTDGFSTVQKINNTSCVSIRFKPNDATVLYQGGSSGELLKSTDGGNNFSLVQDVGNSEVVIAVSPSDPERVYLRSDKKIYKSYNSATSFSSQQATLPENNMVFMFSPTNPDVLLAGNFEIFRSTNDGGSFSKISSWLGSGGLPLIHVDQRNVFANPLTPNFIYFCNDGGLFKYSISTNRFEDLSNGLVITQFYDIAVAQTNVNVIGGGSQDNGNIFRDANGNWDDYTSTGDGMTQAIDPTNHNTRYWTFQYGSIHRWTNGSNKNISPSGESGNGAWETPFRLDPNNANRIIAGYKKVYVSSNKGDSWSSISNDLEVGKLNHVAIAPSNSNRIYAAGPKDIYVKNVNSNNWTKKTIPNINFITDLEVDPLDMNIIYVSNGVTGMGNKVFKSVNAGDTWTDLTGSLPEYSAGAIEIYKDAPGGIFVGTNAGVYYRDNNSSDWAEVGALPHTMVEDIEINYSENLIRVGTHGRGIFEASFTVVECAANAPDADSDGICDENDTCPNLDNSLIGQPCTEGPASSFPKYYTENCTCEENIDYCSAKGAAGTGSDWIKNVQVHTLNNTSTQTDYSDFTNMSTSLKKDVSYTLSVQLNATFPLDKIYAWLDYNRNGGFDSDERIMMSAITSNNSTGTITIPTTAQAGVTRLRVRVIYNEADVADPCNDYFGEVEDYTVDILENCSQVGEPCTEGAASPYPKYYTESCSCEPVSCATNAPDTDSDGICDEYDTCPNLDNALIGQPCTEGAASPYPKYYTENCTCEPVSCEANAPDADSDGICDEYDTCPNLDNALIGQPCTEGAASPYPKYYTENCSCEPVSCEANAPDTDSDGICDEYDTCPNLDNALIGQPCTEGAASPYPKYYTENCSCEPVSCEANAPDADSDGICDEYDTCPNLDNALIGQPCTEGAASSLPKFYTENCSCEPASYCSAKGAAGTGSDWIKNVQLHTIDNTSIQSDYSDFTNISTSLKKDSTYTLSVQLNATFDLDKIYAWIDYNTNGSFDVEEQITMSAIAANNSTGTITIPNTATEGVTRLRVRVIYNEADVADPCNDYSGEVEDYAIEIVESCPPSDQPCTDDATPPVTDSDNDGVSDTDEILVGTNPSDPETIDGIPDGNVDTDGDGISNGDESDESIVGPTDADGDGANDIVTANLLNTDLFPNYTFSSTSFSEGDQWMVVININEISGKDTDGSQMEVFVPFSEGFTYEYDATQTTANIINAEAVNNPDWNKTNTEAGFLFTSNVVIPGEGRSRIVIRVTANVAGTNANLTANITPGSGGEIEEGNNIAVLAKSIHNRLVSK